MDTQQKMFETSYFFTGKTGTGKTYRAREMYDNAVNYYNSIRDFQMLPTSQAVLFKSYPKLVVQIKSYKNIDEILREFEIAKYLVLDDLWGNAIKGFDEIAYIAINSRIEKNKATVVTSNLSLSQIADIDDRLASRLATFKPVLFKGPDRRNTHQKPEVVSSDSEE